MEKPKKILELEKWFGVLYYRLDNNNNVVYLSLISKNITNISLLEGFRELQTLYLSNNQISDISALKNLTQLRSLYLSDNQISDISVLENLLQLETLDLSDNQISNISALENLSQLHTLYLRRNLFFRFNETHFQRKRGNQILDISALKNLTQLQKLDLGGNQISDISALKNLAQLKNLSFEENQISDISVLKNLKQLWSIDLNENNIIEIPIDFFNSGFNFFYENSNGDIVKSIKYINLFGNPLVSPPKDLIWQGQYAIKAYYESLKKGSRPLNEAKLVLIGEPEAGKTSLLNFLLNKPFGETISTKGVNLEQWQIKEDETNYRINLWDFGGQEIQSSVHQFFLTEDTLYVVVLNARQDAQFADRYFEQIKSYAPNSPVIIVINRIDENPAAKIDENRIKDTYRDRNDEPILRSVHKISLLKGHKDGDFEFQKQLEALDTAIRAELMKLPTIHKIVPQSYFDVKEYLESKYFEHTPYISQETYKQICREKNLSADADDELLKYLDILGTVRYFDDLETRNLQILNPEWLTDGVYRILTHERTHSLKGVITEKDLEVILQPTEKGAFEYPKHHYIYLIEMLKRFNLGHLREDKTIFIPKAFAEDYPDSFRPNEFKSDAIHFFFKYETFIPSPIISGFIAKMFNFVKGSLYWEKGIVLEKAEMSETQIALVEQNTVANRIDIWVQGRHSREFFIEIRQVFRDFHQKRIGLVVDEMVVLDERQNSSVKYKVLIANKLKGKSDYTDEEGNDYNINKTLGLFETLKDTNNYTVNVFGGGNAYFGRDFEITIIQKQAYSLEENLVELKNSISETNKKLVEELITAIQAIQKTDSKEKAKTKFDQVKDAIKNLPKIMTEESIKESTKKLFGLALNNIGEMAKNFNAQDIVDFVAQHSLLL